MQAKPHTLEEGLLSIEDTSDTLFKVFRIAFISKEISFKFSEYLPICQTLSVFIVFLFYFFNRFYYNVKNDFLKKDSSPAQNLYRLVPIE